jgi:hypothetical protein
MAMGSPGPVALPTLIFEAPPGLEATAQQLAELPTARFEPAMRLFGLEQAGLPVRVALAPDGSPEAAAVEDWVAGYAYGALGRVVLLVDRTPRYPDGSLEELLDHEIAHVLLVRAAGNRPVPRWFNEGLAMVAGHAWGLGDRSRLTLAMVTRTEVSVAELDRLFEGHRGQVGRAYAVSGALVRDLLNRYGADAAARILRDVRLGLGFNEAMRRATGRDVAGFEAAFWRRHSFLYRWVPILTSSFTLWVGIVLLALVAFRRRRLRNAEIQTRWEIEEELEKQRNDSDWEM